MKTQQLLRSFAGGEITPELYGRADLDKFQTGLAEATNFVILPHGPAQNRAGFKFVNAAKDASTAVRLIPFSYSADQTMVLEFGDGYIRFHTDGGTLLESEKTITDITSAGVGVVTYSGADPSGFASGDWVYISGVNGTMGRAVNGRFCRVADVDTGANTFKIRDTNNVNINTSAYSYTSGGTFARVYEISSPYAAADLFDLHYTQNGDVLTIVHPDYAPRELRRLGATNWSLSVIDFAPDVDAPTAVSGAATVASGTGFRSYKYAVTAVNSAGLESEASYMTTGSTSYTVTDLVDGVLKLNTLAGLAIGDDVYVTGVVGVSNINGGTYRIYAIDTPNSNIHVLRPSGSPTSWTGAYVSGGTATTSDLQNNLATSGNKNTVSWTASSDADRYYVYRRDINGSLYGYIGQTRGTSFVDDNIVPDLTKQPPEFSYPFRGSNNYPGAVGYFEQRRCFAGTDNGPQYAWLTRSGTESSFAAGFPPVDSDAFNFRIASRQNNRIRHLVPLSDLIALTPGAEFRIFSAGGDPLTPSNVTVKPQAYVGASNVQPVTTNSSILYVANAGSHVQELAYSWEAQSFSASDMSLLAPHLFNGKTIVDMAFQRGDCPVLWCVRNDGVLLGFTYIPGQRVYAWHRHTTQGDFKSVCVVSEGGIDRLYAVIERDIDGTTVKYIERMDDRQFGSNSDNAVFLDACATYSGAAATTLYGLWHLEGMQVGGLADGADIPVQTVTNGSISLDEAASKVHVGLAYDCDLKTLPLSLEAAGAGGALRKNIVKAYVRVYKSRGLFVGYDFNNLYEDKSRSTETYGSEPRLRSEMIEVPVSGDWNIDGQVCVRQSAPLPLTVLSMVLDVAVGG